MRGLFSNTRGGVAVSAAIGATLACVVAGVVIDGGSAALYARRLQAAADLSALAAARDLAHAQAAAQATAAANLGGGVEVSARIGVYSADPSLAVQARFRPAGLAEAQAAEVRVSGVPPLWFSNLLMGGRDVRFTRVGRAAVLSSEPIAMLTLGSRLARLDGGIANQVLTALTGSRLALTAMDYDGLARSRVNLLAFMDALSTELGLEVGDYDALLSHQMEAGRLLSVLEASVEGGDPALSALARAADGRRLRIGDLIGVDLAAPESLRRGLDAEVSAGDLAIAALEIASGDRQVALDLPLRAGLASVQAWLAIGERPNKSPWLAVTAEGDIIVRTSQSRLYLKAKTADGLAKLGQLTLPILIELASSEARLAEIDCDPDRAVAVFVRPGVARLRVGEIDIRRVDDFKSSVPVNRAILLDLAGVVRLAARADLNMASSAETRLRFDDADIRRATIKRVASTGFVASPAARLLETLDVDAQALGLPLDLRALAAGAASLLRPLAPVLDDLIDQVLATAGLSLGEADVAVPNAICPTHPRAPVLVG